MRSITISVNGQSAEIPDVASDRELKGTIEAMAIVTAGLFAALRGVEGFNAERVAGTLETLASDDAERNATARTIIAALAEALKTDAPVKMRFDA